MNLKLILKSILRLVLPIKLYNTILLKIKKSIYFKELKKSYEYDMARNIKHSCILDYEKETNLIGLIIREYHVIEKGLTMPETRLGFGKDVIHELINNCIKYANKYDINESQLKHAVGVIFEYEEFHIRNNYDLSKDFLLNLNILRKMFKNIKPTCQKEKTSDDIYSCSESSFMFFSKTRSSIRNFSEINIDLKKIISSLNHARCTPSACNRQPWRTYCYEDKDQISLILKTQGGNRGFGHLTNKLIIICCEIGMYLSIEERNSAYIDGGMYAMNLLYSLHYEKIATCILNCSNSIEKDKILRKLCNIKDSEVFIAMIACGIAPEKIKIASSFRYPIEQTNTVL